MSTEHTAGPTPNGGTYTIAYFSDAAGNDVSKEEATSVEIIEYSPTNDVVGRTYAQLTPQPKKRPQTFAVTKMAQKQRGKYAA